MVLRHVSSACFAEDVHTSLHFLRIGIDDWYDHNIRLFEMCLIVASMIFHSRMMYVDNGTGQSSLYFTALLVPRRSHYTLSCVRREIRLYNSKLNFDSLLNSSLYIYLLYYACIFTLGFNGHITSFCTSLMWRFITCSVLFLCRYCYFCSRTLCHVIGRLMRDLDCIVVIIVRSIFGSRGSLFITTFSLHSRRTIFAVASLYCTWCVESAFTVHKVQAVFNYCYETLS